MSAKGGPPQSDEISTIAEFLAGLHALRLWSGLTYRELAAKARANGDFLPASTIASALNRTSLPREELVASFVRACGHDGATAERWLATRKRLAVGAPKQPREPAEQPREPAEQLAAAHRRGPRRRGRSLTITALGLVLVGGGLAVWTAKDERPAAGPAPGTATPGTSAHRVRSASTGLCLSEVRGRDTGHLTLADCATSHPDMAPEMLPDGTYRINTDHPDFGPGCTGVNGSNQSPGAPLADDYCGGRGSAERFRLLPVTEPLPGFRLELVHSGLCVTMPGPTDGMPKYAVQQPCDPSDPEQVFDFGTPRTN